ncbi:MAG: hypothetical protein DRJ44_03060 [Thermoprotei archaeon]|nr:MAG: hypothetical protein DRJ44_03060 [Thermoprotei archaeon]
MQDLIGGVLASMGVGFLFGFSLGYFSKKVLKLLLIFLGFLLAILILFEFYGIITVNYEKLAEVLLGIKTPSYGLLEQVKNFLWNRLPFAASFFAGFYFGFKKG